VCHHEIPELFRNGETLVERTWFIWKLREETSVYLNSVFSMGNWDVIFKITSQIHIEEIGLTFFFWIRFERHSNCTKPPHFTPHTSHHSRLPHPHKPTQPHLTPIQTTPLELKFPHFPHPIFLHQTVLNLSPTSLTSLNLRELLPYVTHTAEKNHAEGPTPLSPPK